VILAASVIFFVGSVVMGVANYKETLLVGRIIVGIAIGELVVAHTCICNESFFYQFFNSFSCTVSRFSNDIALGLFNGNVVVTSVTWPVLDLIYFRRFFWVPLFGSF